MCSIVLCVLNVCKHQEYPGFLRSYANRKIELIIIIFLNWTKFGFIPQSDYKEEDFQRFPIFQWIIVHGSHLGCMARSLDTILEKDKRKSITSEIGIIMSSGS
jgi:hypothetical protein